MRLQAVPVAASGPLNFICCQCGTLTRQDAPPPAVQTGNTVWADLDGEPFRAYYCSRCAGPYIMAGHGI